MSSSSLDSPSSVPTVNVVPEASPAQKQAQAETKANVTPLPSLPTTQLQTDLKTTKTSEVFDTIQAAQAKELVTEKQMEPPGSYSSQPKGLPDWYRVGWTAFSNLPNPGDEEAMSKIPDNFGPEALAALFNSPGRPTFSDANQEDLVSQFLSEAYYGEWYHNTAVMLFTVVFTWLITRFGGGLMACLVIGAFLATYHQTSIRRLRRNVRDDINREMMVSRLETDAESADWINHFLARFWLIYEPVLSAQIIGTADAILIESTPSFLDSIRLSTFTLGTKAPRIESIKTYPKTEPNVVCMDWKLSFVPNDVLDLSKREVQSKVNPKIVLSIRVGKGMVGVEMPVLLEDIAFSGTLRLKFKLFNEFPHVKTLEASFLDKPMFDYVLKPVGGETLGFDINSIPGLQSFVQDQVHATLGPMMYAPNAYLLDVAGMMAGGVDLDSANGVLGLTLYSAINLKGSDMFGSLDPYVTFHIGNTINTEVGRSSAHEDTSNPKWDETHFLLLNTLTEPLFLQVMDRNVGRKDTIVGVATFDLKQLEADSQAEGLSLVVTRGGKPVGEIKCDLRHFPISLPEKLEDGTVTPPAESNSGVLRFMLHECKELGAEKKGGFGLPLVGGGSDTDAYAIFKVNGVEKLRTMVFKRSVNPRWFKWVEVFVADKTQLNLSVEVMNSKEFSDDECIGRFESRMVDMEEQITKNSQDWWQLKDGTGKIHLGAIWKPVAMTGFDGGLGHGSYREPVGVVRINVFSAEEIKNVEALTGGKSDPYVRVMSGTQVRGQTEYIDDELNPVWNTPLYVPIHSIREDLVLEVMDFNDIQKDKFLGLAEIFLKDIVKEVTTENKQVVYEGLEPVDRWVNLLGMDRKQTKGTLHYSASFFPTLELAKIAEVTEAESKEPVEGETPAEEDDTPKEPAPVVDTHPEKDVHGEVIKYTQDNSQINLLAYESGILKVTVHTVSLKEKVNATIDILIDSNDPQFRTAQAKGTRLAINETGDVFVKEMDFSRVTVRVKPVKEDKDDSNAGYWVSPVRDLVRDVQARRAKADSETDDGSKEYKLLEAEGGGTIRLSFDFIPVVKFTLDPSESLENQGNLTVTALKATNLKGIDRSGTSDPYVVFSMNDVKLHKTEVHKKELNPVFRNEVFTVPVLQRIGAVLIAEVFDWDQIGKNELIGRAEITFAGDLVESFAAKDIEVSLGSDSKLRVRLLWQPQLLARKRTGTNIFSATTRIFTSAPGAAVGAGLGAGGKVLGGGVKVLGGGVKAIGGGIRGIGKLGSGSSSKKSNTSDNVPPVPSIPSPPQVSSPLSSEPSPSTPEPRRMSVSPQNSSIDPSISNDSYSIQHSQTRRSEDSSMNVGGSISISLLGARNLKAMDRGGTSDPYARVRIGSKMIGKTRHIKKTLTPEWNETFTARVSSSKTVLDFKVKDHNTLNDVDIGDVTIDLWDNLRAGQPFDGWLALKPAGTGEIHVRIEQGR
ncbi:C2 domain-containing protein [Phycomyces blakesleeanus]|uniref:C2 domain-containing protein n=1 Tax=Phycomyces blakesleeanus TaxID=4837 RepID=A0ABR3AUM0_PHYBL